VSSYTPPHQPPAEPPGRPDPASMTPEQYREYMADPHAFHPEHHGAGDGHDGGGHHVTSLALLRGVLAALVFFTVLTVAASRGEIWLAETFQIEIPTIVNVMIAMSIATIKAMLVVAIFMHLQWDNRLNLLVLLFTLMGVGLFIGLTAVDLANRDTVYDWTTAQIVPGGIGQMTRGDDVTIGSVPIAVFAREKYIQEHGEEAYKKKLAEHHAGHEHHEPARSPDRSRPMRGRTPGLFDTAPAGDGAGHAEAAHDGH